MQSKHQRRLAGRLERPRGGARGAVTLMIGTLASRVTGLLKQSLLVQLFDRSVTDAFNVALRVPNLFRELLAEGALTNAFVPVYKGLGAAEARRLSGALLSLLLFVNALLVLLAVWAAPWLVTRLLVAPDTPLDVPLIITLTRIVFPVLAALSFSALAMGVLNAEERFFAPAWAPVVLNVVTVALMLAFPGQAVMLAVAFVVGGAAQLLFQLPALARAGLLPRLGVWWHPQLLGVLTLMVPFTFSTSARQFLNVVSSRLLSTLPEGSVTAFSNADLFLSLALGLFSISPALAFYSRLSGQTGDPEAFRATLGEGLGLIALLTAPAGVFLSVWATPVVVSVLDWTPVLGGSGMGDTLVHFSAAALWPLGLAVFPVGLNNLLLRTLYARRRVRTPVALSVAFLGLHALLYALLAPRYGLVGLSAATAAVGWLQLGVLLALVWRRERFDLRRLWRSSLKVWLAAALSALLVRTLLEPLALPGGWVGAALEVVLAGVGVLALYAALCVRLRVPEAARFASAKTPPATPRRR
ncbi:murein biosynthesis integral membrane protein MurJ [Truepera radiovictrix]|uniref:Integral membrane protein MviN n=1 Tax=Truepera radiovictrix (strain DSM 17093 / CIP 108686 / LMG 22925 / RQ-24) TaxID=649638 RepID=D7CWA6_TRURR|nr:murein biosynthesis integral membrane protein MurJ [Truepera radiovictrix]ADI16056.1 integral membrane protein MviN [Truepera radiovictrix DSM 17093]WMT58316.1 murein biosynthesis integral membrane protein MurJ [Truepera radiovictrix]